MQLLEQLVCKGLGYCCPYLFLRLHRAVATSLIALRLGANERTVRRWKASLRTGEIKCKHQSNCMKARLVRRHK